MVIANVNFNMLYHFCTTWSRVHVFFTQYARISLLFNPFNKEENPLALQLIGTNLSKYVGANSIFTGLTKIRITDSSLWKSLIEFIYTSFVSIDFFANLYLQANKHRIP